MPAHLGRSRPRSGFSKASARRAGLAAGAILLVAGCRDPRAEANIAEAMVQVGVELDALRQEQAILQYEVDSLRAVVARQDTALTRLTTLVYSLPRP